MHDTYIDRHGRDAYPGEDDPMPKPCPECGHVAWADLRDVFHPHPEDVPAWECCNCAYVTQDIEEVFE
jgi:hypothetical protein